jgi:hypothetical protein
LYTSVTCVTQNTNWPDEAFNATIIFILIPV